MFLRIVVTVAFALSWGFASRADAKVVEFDVPAIVVAEPINPAVVQAPTMGGQLIRLRIPVSVYIAPNFEGQVTEFTVELSSPYQSLRVVDFWPQNEVYSEIAGTVSVENSQQQDSNFSISLSSALQPVGQAQVGGDLHKKSQQHERYQRNPPMQILSSSGTIHRGYGAFFKFRPGPVPVLEGVRDVAILAEVPRGWRADLLQVSLRAVGHSGSRSKNQTLGYTQLWMTTHREGDAAASAQAARYVTQERELRALAAATHQQVKDRSLPSVWHKLGAAMDVVDPRIPADYLQRIIFGSTSQRFEESTNRLPMELRVAVLDYWETRDQLIGFAALHEMPAYASNQSASSQYVAAKPVVNASN